MIREDQPSSLSPNVSISVSSKSDGTMLNRQLGIGSKAVLESRRDFTRGAGIDYADTVFQWINYTPSAGYNQIVEVDERSTTRYIDGVPADALVTRVPGVGLMLPVADCVATVVYDPVTHALALLHMGRHSTLTNIIRRVIERLVLDGAQASRLQVWMSPHASRQSYRLDYFDGESDPAWQGFIDRRDDGIYVDMSGYNRQQFIDCGVDEGNIDISPVDTFSSSDYYSHSRGDTSGRFAVLAYLR